MIDNAKWEKIKTKWRGENDELQQKTRQVADKVRKSSCFGKKKALQKFREIIKYRKNRAHGEIHLDLRGVFSGKPKLIPLDEWVNEGEES